MAKVATLRIADNNFLASHLGKVPNRPTNASVRPREFLRESEVELIMKAAAKTGRNRLRDRCLIHTAFRHGLRVSELVDLRWAQVDEKLFKLSVRRLKNGTPSTHDILGPDMRRLKNVRKLTPDSPFIFVSKLGGPLTASSVHKIVARAGRVAGLAFPIHTHMLRHACGYALANAGHDTRRIQHYLGHKNIHHTVLYTQLADNAFEGFWK